MSKKSRGCDYERKLVNYLFNNGYWAVRVAGSGSSKHPSPDIIASNGLRVLIIEVKSTQASILYLKKETISKLLLFAKGFGGEPIIAVHYLRKGWYFKNAKELSRLSVIKLIPEEMNRQI